MTYNVGATGALTPVTPNHFRLIGASMATEQFTKVCSECGLEKTLTEFSQLSSKKILRAACKSCHCVRAKEWRSLNRDKVRAQKRRAYHRDPGKHVATVAEWRKKNPEKYDAQNKRLWANRDREAERAQKKEWKRANPDLVRESGARYRKNNPATIAAQTRRGQAARLQAVPAWANHAAIEQFYSKARELTLATGIPHEVDHIVPIRGETVCGLHVEYNLCVLTSFENRSKGNRHWPDMP